MMTPNTARRTLRGGAHTDAEIAEAIRALKHSTFDDDMQLVAAASARLADAHYSDMRNGGLMRARQRRMQLDGLVLLATGVLIMLAVVVIAIAPEWVQAWVWGK